MRKISVNLPIRDDSYNVILCNDFLKKPEFYIEKAVKVTDLVIITDTNIKKICADKLQKILKKSYKKIHLITVPAGEKSKSWQVVITLARTMLQKGFDRKCAILALGGGVVGDLAGFVASIFMRGVSVIQIPTSLLAMVDSSVGGKTGIDVPEGKNLIGSFYQPAQVILDLSFLKTLPKSEFANGMAEVIKYGVIWDEKFFAFLEKSVQKILNRDAAVLEKMVKRCVKIKGDVIVNDEKEKGLRRILNFGHTYGHAIEALSGLTLPHGLAVSIGIHFACKIAEKRGFNETEKIISLLQKFGLQTSSEKKFSPKNILEKMQSEKKTVAGKIYFVLPKRIGKVGGGVVEEKEIKEVIRKF